jgi:hypothetical protein
VRREAVKSKMADLCAAELASDTSAGRMRSVEQSGRYNVRCLSNIRNYKKKTANNQKEESIKRNKKNQMKNHTSGIPLNQNDPCSNKIGDHAELNVKKKKEYFTT